MYISDIDDPRPFPTASIQDPVALDLSLPPRRPRFRGKLARVAIFGASVLALNYALSI